MNQMTHEDRLQGKIVLSWYSSVEYEFILFKALSLALQPLFLSSLCTKVGVLGLTLMTWIP